MITYPSTHGVFDKDIRYVQLCTIVTNTEDSTDF